MACWADPSQDKESSAGRGITLAARCSGPRFWASRRSRPAYCLQLTLPATPSTASGRGLTVRLFFFRGPGADFSERDRALLMLLRPHLRQAYLDAERRRHPVPQLTGRQWDLLRLLAAGHTNAQVARSLGISEGTVPEPAHRLAGPRTASARVRGQ